VQKVLRQNRSTNDTHGLATRCKQLILVDFSSDPSVNWTSAVVNVPASRLMIGLANGWAGGPSPKSVLIMPSDVAGAWSILGDNAPKGVGFWDMPDEGRIPAGQNASLYMARDLNTFLKTRTRMKNVDL